MPQDEKYMDVLRGIMDKQKQLLGEKVAIGEARSAPLEITPDGEIKSYYGEGKNAVDMLTTQYEETWGKEVTDEKIIHVVEERLDEEDYSMVAERIRPEKGKKEEKSSFADKLKSLIG